MTPSDLQAQAIAAIKAWWLNPNRPQVFYLAGYAGTGKSTVYEVIRQELEALGAEKIVTCTFTGKAANVLRRKGTPDAMTIHAATYSFEEDPKTGRFTFTKNPMGPAASADLIALDECFVRGSMVDTDKGPIAIESVGVGQSILNASGVDRVVAVSRKVADVVVRISSGKATFETSESHPFLTSRGFVRAADLQPGDDLVPTIEAMRLLREALHARAQESLPTAVHKALRDALVAPVSGVHCENLYAGAKSEVRGRSRSILQGGFSRGGETACADLGLVPIDQRRGPGQDQREAEGHGAQASSPARQWVPAARAPEALGGGAGGRLDHGVRRGDRVGAGLCQALQTGHLEPRPDDRDRSGRTITLSGGAPGERRSEGRLLEVRRVDRVEVLQSGDSSLDRVRDVDGNVYLYDLQAARHSSFSVEGCLVHNCSMVDDDMAEDLLSFGKPILVMGDPGQLPPIRGPGAFTAREPDFFLHEIHRQAAESPILRIATAARLGERIELGDYGAGVKVLQLTAETAEEVYRDGTQAICGIHTARHKITAEYRKRREFDGVLPMPGETLICCRNDRPTGLFNGGLGIALKSRKVLSGLYRLDVQMEDREHPDPDLVVSPHHFLKHTDPTAERPQGVRGLLEFDWGYVLTCHKAQGSEWPHVTIVDDSGSFRTDRNRWLYTALTRASEGLTLLKRTR